MGPKHAPLGRRLLNFDMERQFVFMAAMATDRPYVPPLLQKRGRSYMTSPFSGGGDCQKIDNTHTKKVVRRIKVS